MTIRRRTVLAGFAGAAALSTQARAEKITLRWATVLPVSHPVCRDDGQGRRSRCTTRPPAPSRSRHFPAASWAPRAT